MGKYKVLIVVYVEIGVFVGYSSEDGYLVGSVL